MTHKLTIPACDSYKNEITKSTDTEIYLADVSMTVIVKYKYRAENDDTGLTEDRLCDFTGVYRKSEIAGVVLIWNTVDKTYDLDITCGGQVRSFYMSKDKEPAEKIFKEVFNWIFNP